MSDKIELYYWPTPNGWKISIALAEMEIPYNLNLVNIGAGDQFKPEFLEISPNNRMPAIQDPNGPENAPISIFESGAILQYLARKTGQFYGNSERYRLEIDQWLMWQMGGVGPMAGQAHHFLKYAPLMDPPKFCPMPKIAIAAKSRVYMAYWISALKGAIIYVGDIPSQTWPYGHGPVFGRGNNKTSHCSQIWPLGLNGVGNRPAVIQGRSIASEKRSNNSSKEEQKNLFKTKP